MKQKTILFGITGGIAAVKIPELIRMLVADQVSVLPMMTENAELFIERTEIEMVRASSH